MSRYQLANPDIARIFQGETVSGLSEWQLLARYLERRDEIAFEALVARHGPMVLGVCRRMLAEQADVEDAFQATFLVLVRRARQLGPRDAIGAWLHGVAARVSLRARSEAARRRRLEPIGVDVSSARDHPAGEEFELGEILDQELDRLPSKYRSPVVLCYLEGQTHEEAARQLEWPIGTVKGRLARARDLLRMRLARRGLAPTAGALSLALARGARAACGRELLQKTVNSCLKLAMGQSTAATVSASIASLVQGVMTSMLLDKIKWAAVAVLASGLALTGAGVMARQNAKPQQRAPQAVEPVEEAVAKASRAGEPSPAGGWIDVLENKDAPEALLDLKKQLYRAARMEWESALKEFTRDHAGMERAYQASKRLLDAENGYSALEDKGPAAKDHLDRMRQIARYELGNPSATDLQRAQVNAYAAEAQLWLAQTRKGEHEKADSTVARATAEVSATPGEPSRSQEGKAPGDGRGNDPKSRQILAKLEEPVSMSFHEETPLEDVLKYIKQATTTPSYSGIQIYVDPVGLQEAEKSMTSTVRNMDLEGVPLRRTLQLLLKQINLIYFVEDGMLYITSEESEGPLPPSMHRPSPLTEKVEKAERGELTPSEMKALIELLKAREEVRKLNDNSVWGGEGTSPAEKQAKVNESKRNQELVDILLKEVRDLVEALKAEKQTKGAAQAK